MSIPNYQELMLPVLKKIEQLGNTSKKEITPLISKDLQLSEQERSVRIKSGGLLIQNRVGWAVSYMKQGGLVYYPSRGRVEITDIGKEVLKKNPKIIDNEYLKQFDDFNNFLERNRVNTKKDSATIRTSDEHNPETPEEQIDTALKTIETNLVNDLLEAISNQSPQFFEQLVVDLMLAMGYGGEVEDAGLVTNYTNDEGIDGLIKEDKLGLETIYLQAKRWQATIGRPEIQKFVGALQGKRAKKGVFITTSKFSHDAEEYAKTLDCKVVLIDGQLLARYMIEYDVGVQSEKQVSLKKIDEDYWG